MNLTVDLRDPEKIRQQFDYGPYPRKPLEESPRQDFQELYIHNLVRHPQRSWWLDECDRPKGGWLSLKVSVG
ncbi:MAG: hypothetical protein ACKO7W_03335 [Elainella sp.]